MPNRQLTPPELERARALLEEIRAKLHALSDNDPELLFAYRRKIYKELTYDERSSPMKRRQLKQKKLSLQSGRCAACAEPLPAKHIVLDRFEAWRGYTEENTRLICEPCDRKIQQERGFA